MNRVWLDKCQRFSAYDSHLLDLTLGKYIVKNICLRQNICWLSLIFHLQMATSLTFLYDIYHCPTYGGSFSQWTLIPERKHKEDILQLLSIIAAVPWGKQKTFSTECKKKKRMFPQGTNCFSYTQRIWRCKVNYVFNKLFYFVRKCSFLFWECFS